MAHEVKYTRQRILRLSYQTLKQGGFHKFSARELASKSGFSTQPIYRQFNNIDELWHILIDTSFIELQEDTRDNEYGNQPLVILDASLLHFTESNRGLAELIYKNSPYISYVRQRLYQTSLYLFERTHCQLSDQRTVYLINRNTTEITSLLHFLNTK